jgi:hypothetical protein
MIYPHLIYGVAVIWVTMKAKVYVNSSHSLKEMKDNIQRETANQGSPFLKM